MERRLAWDCGKEVCLDSRLCHLITNCLHCCHHFCFCPRFPPFSSETIRTLSVSVKVAMGGGAWL